MRQVVAEVSKRVSSTAAAIHRKSIVVESADSRIHLTQGPDDERFVYLPVTWAIPPVARVSQPADERQRITKRVVITGVRVRFTLNYNGPIRLRMVLYKPRVAFPFVPTSVTNVNNTAVEQFFPLHWTNLDGAQILPHGPFSVINKNRIDSVAPPVDNWQLESSDHTAFTADFSQGKYRPLSEFSVAVSGTPGAAVSGHGAHSNFQEVDWYTGLKRPVVFQYDDAKLSVGPGLQVLLYYDSPIVGPLPTEDVTVGTIPVIAVKVYYHDA